MKRTISILLVSAFLFLTAVSLFACGGDSAGSDGTGANKDKNSLLPGDSGNSPADPASVDFEMLCRTVDGALSGEYIPRDSDYIEYMMMMPPSAFSSQRVLVSTSGGSIDEYGIFEVLPGKDVSEIADSVKEYFSMLDDQWNENYIPEEYPKLRDAKVKTFGGRYAVYAILGEEDRNAVFSAAEGLFG